MGFLTINHVRLQQPIWYCLGVISSLMRPGCQLWAFNAKVTAFPGIAPPPYSYGWPTAFVLFAWDAWGGYLYGCAAFSFCDLGSPRTGLSSAMSPGSLDLLCSSSGISSFLAWALGLIWNGLRLPNPLAPHMYIYIYIIFITYSYHYYTMYDFTHTCILSSNLATPNSFDPLD